MTSYSVLLLYPDYLNDGGRETFYGWTESDTPKEAVANVQRDATTANEDSVHHATDFAPLLVLEGHRTGLDFG